MISIYAIVHVWYMQLKNPCLPSIVLKERLSHVHFQKLSQAR